MKSTFLSFALAGLATLSAASAGTVALTVAGTSNLWLAGQPNGTLLAGDSAPAQSPPAVALSIQPGSTFTFSAAGTVGYPDQPAGPDGATAGSHGAAFGVSGISANWNALIGVFVTDAVPGGAAPSSLNFGAAGLTTNFTALSPLLGQSFFIGDGLTSGGIIQQFVVPVGATRLFLGTLDGSGWYNNTGSFAVTASFTPLNVSTVPDAGSIWTLLIFAGLGLAGCSVLRRNLV
ncbi:MAG: hypothetical protein U1F61_09860 [Opitutaceae bacterium]